MNFGIGEYLYIIHTHNYDIDGNDTTYKFGCTTNIARRKFDSCYTTAIPYPCKYVAFWQLNGISCNLAESYVKAKLINCRASAHATEIFKISKANLIELIESTLTQFKIQFVRFNEDPFTAPPERNDNEEFNKIMMYYMTNNVNDLISYSIINKLYTQVTLTSRVKCEKCKKLTKKPIDVLHSISPGTIYYGSDCFKRTLEPILKCFPSTPKLLKKGYTEKEIIKSYVYNEEIVQNINVHYQHIYYKFINEILSGDYTMEIINKIDSFDKKSAYINYSSLQRAELIGILAYYESVSKSMIKNKFNEINRKLNNLSSLTFDLWSIFEFGLSNNLFKYIKDDLQISTEEIDKDTIKHSLSSINNSMVIPVSINVLPEIITDMKFKYTFAPNVTEFVNKIPENKACLITGGPGTGKTTIVNSIIVPYLMQCGYIIKFCAPTAAAANNIVARFLENCEAIKKWETYDIRDMIFPYTLHKLFKKTHSSRPILYVIDEISMLSIQVLAKFIKNIQPIDKLIFIGDNNQLPPVNGIGVFPLLNEIISLKLNLQINYRAKGAMQQIYKTSTNYNKLLKLSFFITPRGESYDKIHKMESDSIKDCVDYIFNNFNIRKKADLSYKKLLIITYTNNIANNIIHEIRHKIHKSNCTCNKNLRLCDDPKACSVPQFIVDDHIIFKKNDENNMYYNGQHGIITKTNPLTICTNFENNHNHTQNCKLIMLSNTNHIKYSYCVTVHSAQGSEANNVCYIHYKARDAKLIYTAITRTKVNLRIINVKTQNKVITNTHEHIIDCINHYIKCKTKDNNMLFDYLVEIIKIIKSGRPLTTNENKKLKKILSQHISYKESTLEKDIDNITHE